jgi:hypothetical protein
MVTTTTTNTAVTTTTTTTTNTTTSSIVFLRVCLLLLLLLLFQLQFLFTLFSSYFSSSLSSSRKDWDSCSALVSGNGRVLISTQSYDILIEVFHGFTHLLQAVTEILPPSDHGHYHPNFSKFIMYHSSHQLMQHGNHKY